MSNLILILIPILLTDVVNPVLLAAVIFALGSKKPLLNANAVLFGWLIPESDLIGLLTIIGRPG